MPFRNVVNSGCAKLKKETGITFIYLEVKGNKTKA